MEDAPLIGVEDGVIVRFYEKERLNKFETKKLGRPIYANEERVEISFAADKLSVIDQLVREHHRNRFPQSYKAFKEGRVQIGNGYPIKKWDVLDHAMKATLTYLNIHTIEQLAELPDSNVGQIGMGGHELRERAKKWVSANSVDHEKEDMKKRLAELEKKAGKEKDEEEVKPRKKGGRPKKVELVEEDLPPHMKD